MPNDVHLKKDPHNRHRSLKETYKRDLLTQYFKYLNAAQRFTGSNRTSNETCTHGKRTTKETYICEKRPIKETFPAFPAFHRQQSYVKWDMCTWKKIHKRDLYLSKKKPKTKDLLTLFWISPCRPVYNRQILCVKCDHVYGKIPTKETYIYPKKNHERDLLTLFFMSPCRPVYNRQLLCMKCDLYIRKNTHKRDLYLSKKKTMKETFWLYFEYLRPAQYIIGSYCVWNVIYVYGKIPTKETYIYPNKKPWKRPFDSILNISVPPGI